MGKREKSRTASETEAVEVEEFHPLNAASPAEANTPVDDEGEPEYGKILFIPVSSPND